MLKFDRKIILKAIVSILLLLQFSSVINIFSRESSNWSILFSKDADGAVGVQSIEEKYFFKVDHLYGTLYYKVAYLIKWFNTQSLDSDEREKTAHFSLMLTTFLCFLGISLLLGLLIGRNLFEILFLFLIFNSVFLYNSTWATWVIRPHPDFMMALLVTLGMLFSIKLANDSKNIKLIILTATFFALGVQTKLNALFFIPPIIFLWFPPIKKDNFKFFSIFGIVGILAYVVSGFQKKVNIFYPFSFTKTWSRGIMPVTYDSVTYIAGEFLNQLWLPILILTLLKIIYYKETDLNLRTKRSYVVPGLMVLFAVLLTFKINQPFTLTHYPIPVVVALLILWNYYLESIISRLSFLKKIGLRIEKYALIISLLVLVCIPFTIKFVPQTMYNIYSERSICRNENEKAYLVLKDLLKEDRKIMTDPYVPIPRHFNVMNTYAMKMEDLSGVSVIGVKSGFYRSYLKEAPPTHVIKEDLPAWWASNKFYAIVEKGNPFYDLNHDKWQRIYNDEKCGNALWKKEANKK